MKFAFCIITMDQDHSCFRRVFIALGVMAVGAIAYNSRQNSIQLSEQDEPINWVVKELGQPKDKSGSHFQNLLEIKIERMDWLLLDKNKNPQLPHKIQDLPFLELTRLELSDNMLASVETLSLIFAPKLQYLELSNNKIRETKALRKICSEQMTWLQLFNNPLVEMNQMTQLNSDRIMFFWMEFFENDIPTGDDIRWFCKIESKSVTRLHINGQTRILQKHTLAAIKRKNVQIQIRNK